VVGPAAGGLPAGTPALGADELGEDVPVRRPRFVRRLPAAPALPAAPERAPCALDDGCVARLGPADTGAAPGVPLGATCEAGFGVWLCDPGTNATLTAPTVATAATAATFAPPPARSERMRSRNGPRLSPLTARRRRLPVASSAPARCRRARKMSVSTADCETPRSSAISAYDKPFHSRSRKGRRRFAGIFASASPRPINSSCCRWAAGTRSFTCSRSAACSSFVRRELATARDTQTFCAILNSHAVSEWGTTPWRSAPCARRKVLWTASSASSRERNRERQNL
jgi:hypothetical protein